MKKNSSGAIWGLILILLGISIASNSLGIFSITIFFKGWWTLLIIIPCFIGLCNGSPKKKMSNIIGLCIGGCLLLSQWGIHVPWRLLGPLLFAGMFISFGAKLIIGDNSKKKKDADNKSTQYYQEDIWVDYSGQQEGYTDGNYGQNSSYTEGEPYEGGTSYSDSDASDQNGFVNRDFNKDGFEQPAGDFTSEKGSYDQQGSYQYYSAGNNSAYRYSNTRGNQSNQDYRDYRNGSAGGNRVACTAIFNGKSLKYDYEEFSGGIFSVVFGGIDLDLRHAVIHNDVTIEAKVIFGGMDIILPDNVRVSVDSTGIFGGVDNKKKNPPITNEYIPTIYINVTCIMGGVDIK